MHRRLRNKKPWKDCSTIVIDSDDSSDNSNKNRNESFMANDSSSENDQHTEIEHSEELLGNISSTSPINDINSCACSRKPIEKDRYDHCLLAEVKITKLRTFKTYGKVKRKCRKLSNEWDVAKKTELPNARTSGKKWSVDDKLKNVEVDHSNGETWDVNDRPQNASKYLFDSKLITPITNGRIGSPDKHSTPLCTDLLRTKHVRRSLKNTEGFHRTISYVSPLKNNSNIETVMQFNDKTAALSSLSLLKPDSFYSVTKDVFNVSSIITTEGKILNLCEQENIINIDDYINDSNSCFVRKIAEGSYGEVFEKKKGNGDSVVVKIVPVGCKDVLVNGIPQMTLEEVLSEMAISKALSGLKEINNGNTYKTEGFIQLHRLLFCQGCYPSHLIKLWEHWDSENKSENDNPEMLMHDQMYIIFETDYCGTDLEKLKVKSQAKAFSILKQIVASLAAAEKLYQFEHRDLHWGNVLIMDTNKKTIDFVIEGEEYSFDSHGVLVSIIDFTLSRIQGDEFVVYTDLCKERDLFKGQGDIQFNVYRDMKEHNDNDWESFKPYTNVLWIHYLTKKLIRKARHSVLLKQFLQQVLRYNSAHEILKAEFID